MQPKGTKDVYVDGILYEQWHAIRKEAGLRIDPETAEVWWEYGLTLDPYGVLPELPLELQQVGREYFARSPGSEIWVSFDDLPQETIEALMRKHRSAVCILSEIPF